MKYPQEQLIQKAEQMMGTSRDPIHDLAHVKRVVSYVQKLANIYKLSADQTHALILAAWWHDVARTITKEPSIVIMPFIDDIISACMLWYATVRHGLFGPVAGMATRMIFCKSFGAGKILTKLLIRKKNRILVNILEDADNLDVLHIERTKSLFTLAERSYTYHLGYRLSIWWFLSTTSLEMKTDAAKVYLLQLLKDFIRWMQQADILQWHKERFGQKWVNRQMEKATLFVQTIEQQISHLSYSHQ